RLLRVVLLPLGLIEMTDIVIERAVLDVIDDRLPRQINTPLILQAADHIGIRRQKDQPVLFLPRLFTTMPQYLLRSAERLIALRSAVTGINGQYHQLWPHAIIVRYVRVWRKHMDGAELVITTEHAAHLLFQQRQQFLALIDVLLAAFHLPAQVGPRIQPIAALLCIQI